MSSLKLTGGPARQLLYLYALKLSGRGSRVRVSTSTYPLLKKALVAPEADDSCFVTLTDAGQLQAEHLSSDQAGQGVLRQAAQEVLQELMLSVGGVQVEWEQENLIPAEDRVTAEEEDREVRYLDDVLLLLKCGLARTDVQRMELLGGLPQRCHYNAAREFYDRYDAEDLSRRAGLHTGYALDGRARSWLRHTWLVREDGTLLETTVPWAAYFGIELGHAELTEYPQGAAWDFTTLHGQFQVNHALHERWPTLPKHDA